LLPAKADEESKEAEEEESCFPAGSRSPLDPEPEAKARTETLRQQFLKEAEAEIENIGTEIRIAYIASIPSLRDRIARARPSRERRDERQSKHKTNKTLHEQRKSKQTKPQAWRVGGRMDEKLMDEKLVN
jgi:hypothetical protein